ncbi:MAG: RIP metalloprotease RseP [Clostridia bacterium]
MTIIIGIIKLLIILCIVATVHEFGHFIAAKLFKIGVNEFSIGFGPKIFQKKIKETMYSLRWIPLGGYVVIDGEGEESDKPNSFSKKNTLQKIIVLVMGVIFNLILAFIILMSISFRVPTFTTEITKFTENSALEQAGIQIGDVITKINDKKVTIGQDMLSDEYTNNQNTKIEYIRNSKTNVITITNAVKDVGYIGASFSNNGDNGRNKIETVRGGKSAEKAGLKSGDTILEVENISVIKAADVINIIKQNANKEIELKIDRKGEILIKKITPQFQKQFNLGIADTKKIDTNFMYAFDKSVKIVGSVVDSYVSLFKGKVTLDDVSSIVGIGVVVSETNGMLEYLNILAIISLAVGAANILPFPPLDGGKIILILIEAVTRKKIPLKVEAIISYIGFGLLFLLTIIVTFKDILRIL